MMMGLLRLSYIVFWSTLVALMCPFASLVSFGFGISHEHTTHRLFQYWASKATKFTHSCLGDALTVSGPALTEPPTIITANHASWIDICLLVTLYQKQLPVMLFVLKKQLMYVPLFGYVAYLMGCPLLSRSGHRADIKAIQNAVKSAPHACLVIFPEGTRFSKEKRNLYQHILDPKGAGISIIAKSQKKPRWLDCHIYYENPPSIFNFLMGKQGKVSVLSEWVNPIEKDSINKQWNRKEAWLSEQCNT